MFATTRSADLKLQVKVAHGQILAPYDKTVHPYAKGRHERWISYKGYEAA